MLKQNHLTGPRPPARWPSGLCSATPRRPGRSARSGDPTPRRPPSPPPRRAAATTPGLPGCPCHHNKAELLARADRSGRKAARSRTSSSSGATTSATANISAYNRGMMGYRTPNIDRIAKEGAIFTDCYGQQSCTAGRAAFITGQSPFRTGLLKVGLPGAKEGCQTEDPTIAELLKPQGYATRPVRQEPPRRPQRDPADRPRLRRVLRQPLPPQRRGGAGERRTTRRTRSSRSGSARAACSSARRRTRTTRPSTRASARSASRRSRTPAR